MEAIEQLVIDIAGFIRADHYAYFILATRNAFTGRMYRLDQGEATHDVEGAKVFEAYSERIQRDLKGTGILLLHKAPGASHSYKIISYYNPEIFDTDQFELILFQELAIEPKEEERKAVLKKSIKAEKIKQTLVYSCYENDKEEILIRARSASKTQLDKRLQYTGTPLGFCARHDNLEGFRAVASAGANVGKISLSRTPLAIAFERSPEIVRYIRSDYREIFDKEIKKRGFLIATQTHDVELLQLLLDAGCDMHCAGEQFPPLHSFADYNNLTGIRFLIDRDVDVGIKNKRKETPLDRAVLFGSPEAADLLREYGAG